ncbi:MAG: InlB B-repeat-containing protein [Spirochaetaceae bacterium]|nr:InlB B-repeat-containing protein [Spirochaetaceae bacterium]
MGKFMKTGTVLLLGAVVFLVGCSSPTTATKLSSDALLTSVKVAGVDAILGNPGQDWEETIRIGNVGHVFLSRPLLEEADVVVQASSGAVVYYAQAKATVEPYFQSETVFDFDADDYLFIEVFSQNHDAFSVYAIQVHSRNPGLTDITFDGRSLYGGVLASGRPILQFGSPGKPGETWDNVEEVGEALFDTTKGGDPVRITFRPEVPYLKIWTTVVSGNTEPDFSTGGYNGTDEGWDLTNGRALNGESVIDGAYSDGDSESGIYITTQDQSFIYIKVQGGTEDEVSFYKLKMVAKSNNRVISEPRFEIYDGNTLIDTYPVGLGPMGINKWAGDEYYGGYENGAEIADGYFNDGSDHNWYGGGPAYSNQNPGGAKGVDAKGILSLYLDAEMDADPALKGVPGSDSTKNQHNGTRPPTNLRVVFKGDLDGTLAFCQPRKNQRDDAVFDIASGDFGNLVGFWYWGVEVTSALGEKGWYKFATRIGSQKADALGSLTINGVEVNFTGVEPAYASAHYDPANDFTYATVTLPANTNFGNALQVVAKRQTGYYPLVSVASAPDHITNVTDPAFNESQDKNFNSVTGEWNGVIPPVEPGSFIYVRTTAEISWYYGGSGFTDAAWAPNRNIADSDTRYGVQRFYKVQVLKAGAQDGADLTDISNKGTALNTTVASAKVTPTETAATLTSGDRKGNVEVGVTVSRTWSAQTGNDVQLTDFASPNFAAVLAQNSANARVGFAIRTAATEASNAPVDSTLFMAPARFNAEANIQSNTWLVARVISESGKNTNFYRFHLLNTEGNDTVPGAVTVNTVAVTGSLADGLNAAATGTNVLRTTLPNKAAFDSVTIAVTKPHASALVAIGLTDVNNAAPAAYIDTTGTGTAASATFDYVPIAQFAVIRIISADRSKTVYYKLRLELANAQTETSITGLTIGGNNVTQLPGPNTLVTDETVLIYNIPGALTVFNNLQVNVTPALGATVGYAMTAGNPRIDVDGKGNITYPDVPTDYSENGLFPTFQNGNYLVFRVTAENNINVVYYKVRIINAWTVSFDTDGGSPSTISSVTVMKTPTDDQTMGSLPANPSKSSFNFDGWYLASDTGFTGTRYIATTVIKADTSLKAKWEAVSPEANASIRSVSGTGPATLYGLYIGGQPGISNGTPGTSVTDTSIVNGVIGGSNATVVGGKTVVVITEEPDATKVEYAISTEASPPSPVWETLTKDSTNTPASLTGKRWIGTLPTTHDVTASTRRYVFVRITAKNGTSLQVYRYAQYVSYSATSPRATLTALSIGGVDVLTEGALGTVAGWWNKTVAPDFEPGSVELESEGEVTVSAIFNNTGVNAVTSWLRIPKDNPLWPFTEDTVLSGFVDSATSVDNIEDGDYILIRYIPTDTSGDYYATYAHYLIKVTVDPGP